MAGIYNKKKKYYVFNQVFHKKKKSFEERLGKVKSLFRSALEDAESLNAEMQQSINSKTEEITKINSEISVINDTMEENSRFILALKKIVE